MGIEEVGIGAATATGVGTAIAVGTDVGEELAVNVVGVFGVVQTGVEIDAPTQPVVWSPLSSRVREAARWMASRLLTPSSRRWPG